MIMGVSFTVYFTHSDRILNLTKEVNELKKKLQDLEDDLNSLDIK